MLKIFFRKGNFQIHFTHVRELGKCKSSSTNSCGLKECRDEIANGDKNFSEWKGRHSEPLPLDPPQHKRCEIVQRQQSLITWKSVL